MGQKHERGSSCNVRPPATIAFSWGELITPISRTGLWYTNTSNNELVPGANLNQCSHRGPHIAMAHHPFSRHEILHEIRLVHVASAMRDGPLTTAATEWHVHLELADC